MTETDKTGRQNYDLMRLPAAACSLKRFNLRLSGIWHVMYEVHYCFSDH